MRKVYRCKSCKKEKSIYDGVNIANSPLFNCPYCGRCSSNSLVEDWADISWVTFDEDINRSVIDGSFELTFRSDL